MKNTLFLQISAARTWRQALVVLSNTLPSRSTATTSLKGGLAVFATIVVIACGCATTPGPRYYTLDMRASGTIQPEVNVRIDRLRECEPLARKDILIQRSPTEVEYYALDQWAASVSEQVARKLSTEFGPVKEGTPTISITGAIENFEQVDAPDGAEAHVRLTVEFRANGVSSYTEPLAKKTYEVRIPAERTAPGAVVAALSRCLEKIAADIAVDAAAAQGKYVKL